MGWRLIETDEKGDDILTDSELIGIGVYLGQEYNQIYEPKFNIYLRAWTKIQSAVEKAIENDNY